MSLKRTRPAASRPGSRLSPALLAAVALLAALGWFVAAQLVPAGNPDSITVTTRSGVHRFTVEWATTPEAQARGLMHRQTMAADRGMVFDFGSDGPRVFWMKDTPLPLDMVFIHADGTVYRIEHRTVPYSEDPVPSGAPVRYVLEVPGGTARRIDLQPGDRVRLN